MDSLSGGDEAEPDVCLTYLPSYPPTSITQTETKRRTGKHMKVLGPLPRARLSWELGEREQGTPLSFLTCHIFCQPGEGNHECDVGLKKNVQTQ